MTEFLKLYLQCLITVGKAKKKSYPLKTFHLLTQNCVNIDSIVPTLIFIVTVSKTYYKRFPERSPQEKSPQEKCPQKKPTGKTPTRKNPQREKCPQGKMSTGKYAHKEKCPQGKMATRKNAHMYNSFKIVTGMSAFVKKRAMRKGILRSQKS